MIAGDTTDIVHFEQCVNDRLGTDPAPRIPKELLPETQQWQPMAWARVEKQGMQILCDDDDELPAITNSLDAGDGMVMFPVHPLMKDVYPAASLVYRGQMAVSASYRTVFVEPDSDDPIATLVPPGHVLMIKLHLDDVLPGIAGDRRLTPSKVKKCVALSALFRTLFRSDGSRSPALTVLREQFGLLHEDRGALFRFVPRDDVIPAFSLYSRDRSVPQRPPMLIELMERFGWSAATLADRLADWLAEPILSGFLAAFQQGFSFEMHGQNTLLSIAPDGKIRDVFFRDLESVIYFPEIRTSQELAPIDLSYLGSELYQKPRNPTRWFNRNIDHDIGRIFQWTLFVLERESVFDKKLSRIATRRIQRTARRLIEDHELNSIAWPGRWLPYSRTPYGSGLRRRNFYRSRFR